MALQLGKFQSLQKASNPSIQIADGVSGLKAGAPLRIWIDGFEAFFGDWKNPNFSTIPCQHMLFYWLFSNIDGFSLTHQTHADEAPEREALMLTFFGNMYPSCVQTLNRGYLLEVYLLKDHP